MMRAARLLIATTCCLLAVASFTAPALRGMIAQPPPPLDPGSTVPTPSATPSEPGKEDVEPSELSHTEAADDSQDSGDAGEQSPTPSPSPSPTPSS